MTASNDVDSGVYEMMDVSICHGLVCEAFPSGDVFVVDGMLKLDLGVKSEQSGYNADQNELCGGWACCERTC